MGYSYTNFKENGEIETKVFDWEDGKCIERQFNDDVVDFLKLEEKQLRISLKKCLGNNDFAMYKNLIQAYERVIELIKKYDWKLMYSEYDKQVDSEHFQKQIAIWEQNGDGNIKNHKIWNVESNNCNN